MSGTQPCPIDEEIGRILNNYLDQAARGIRCSEHELLARYPQHAPVLKAHLAVLKGMPDTLPVCPVDEARLDPTAALADPPDALHPELHIPGYRVLGRIGQGGMGVVYLGEEYATGLFIAIKCPQGSFLDNVVARQCFAREAEAWTKLTHPNIVRAFDIRDDKTTDYRPAIFMQYCDRGSMADRLKDRGPSLSPDNLDILIQVCWGMEFAHAQGFVHCDLKPSNVLLNSEGSALVTDFGLVRSLAAPSEASPRRFQDTLGLGQQALSRVAGTPPYMPPEQWRPGVELGTRVDVYAFGIMLYEAVCGTLPFKPARLSEWRMCHEHTEPPNPREFNCCIPGSLAALMVSCLAKRPEERPAGFAAVAESLAIAYRELTHEEHASRRSKPTRIEVSKAEKEAHAWALLRLAGGCRLRGDLTEADRQYHEALSVFEQTGHKRGMGTCYTNLGVLASRRCEYEDAVELFNLDLGICSELDDRQGIAKCLGNMGIVAASSGQYEKAMGLYRRSLGIKEQIKDLAGMGACYTNMGILASKRGKYEEARELLRKSLAIKEELSDKVGTSACYTNLGNVAQALGDYDEAHHCYSRALTIKQELGDRSGIAACYLNLGDLARLRGGYGEALDLCATSLAINQELGDRARMAICYSSIGTIDLMQGRLDSAFQHYQNQLAICTELGNRAEMSKAYNNLGIIASRYGKVDEAMDYFRLGLGICSELDDRVGLAKCYDNMGILASRIGRADEATELFQKSLALKKSLGDRVGQSACYTNMGTLAARLGKYDEAMDSFRRSLALKEELDDSAGKAVCLVNMGSVAMLRGRHDEAMTLLCRSLAIREELGDRAGVANCYLSMAEITGARGDDSARREHLGRAIRLLDELGLPVEPELRQSVGVKPPCP